MVTSSVSVLASPWASPALNGTGDQHELWPALYGVIAASSLVTLVVTSLLCTVLTLVHIVKVTPKKSAYTLREVVPPGEVEKILQEVDEFREGDGESEPGVEPEDMDLFLRAGLTLTGRSEHTQV